MAGAWYERVGAALDGVVAKRRDLPYQSQTRTGGVKIKRLRSADCVVGGYRLNRQKNGVGSLLLGLYGDDGKLHHVGFTPPGFTVRHRAVPAAGVQATSRGFRSNRCWSSRCNTIT